MSDVDALRARLVAAREAARTAAEACAAVADVEWFNDHSAAAPAEHRPAHADLIAWLSEGPPAARAEAGELLDDLARRPTRDNPAGWPDATGGWQWEIYRPGSGGLVMRDPANDATLNGPALVAAEPVVGPSMFATLPAVHARWCALPADSRPRHPLAPLVKAWQRRPTHRQARALGNRGSLPRLSRLGADDATLPDFPLQDAPAAPGEQLDLPGFGDAVRGCASWLLWLFDQAGGESLASGRGAPWDLRLFVYALLHLDVADRDGEWHTIRLPTDTVTGWLHPHGWANERRDWDKLPEALRRMSRELSYVPVDGIGYVAMMFPSVIPAQRGDPLVEFTARVPRVAAHGDRLNWPRLLAYGADSARLFRAYLAVTAWLGRSAKRGHPITRQIAAPVHGPDGKPARRRKGGAIVRSATERIDNPAARYVGPPLSETDLTRMIGFDPSDRRRRHDARAAFERMEADGVIEIEHSGAGWLLFGGPNG